MSDEWEKVCNAQCPVCGKIFSCRNNDMSFYYGLGEDVRCNICRCKECRGERLRIRNGEEH